MKVFVDTSAILSLLDADDDFHARAREGWGLLLDEREALFTSNYVMVESMALIQRRIGMGAIRALSHDIGPMLDIVWVDRQTHEHAVASLLAANRRQLSLVDLTSFSLMREQRIDTTFTFDAHFAEQGFAVVPD